MAETDEPQRTPAERPAGVFLELLSFLTPYTPKSDPIRWPLERHVRKSWHRHARLKAMYQTTVWLKAYLWCGVLSALIGWAIHGLTGSWAGMWLLVTMIPCFAQALRWYWRASKRGVAWRNRMIKEATERLAETNPDRPLVIAVASGTKPGR